MRLILAATLVLVAALAHAQPKEEEKSLFVSAKPDAWIVVRKHQVGTELVEITMLQPKYPGDLLRGQIDRLGQLVGVKPWGIQVGVHAPSNASMSFTKGSLAINNLVDKEKGIFRLQALVQAFAGAPEANRIRTLSILFEGARPTVQTLMKFSSDAVRVEAQSDSGPIGLEYRVQLKTQDPNRLLIPESQPAALKPPLPKPETRTDWTVWALIAGAAVAVGALVYSLMLRSRPRPR